MASGLTEVREGIAAAARRVGRDPAAITLVAVSKTATSRQIQEVYEAGHRDFGENRADLLAAHAAAVPDDARWHFIGHLQGNKVSRVRSGCHLLHSVDRMSIGEAWVRQGAAPPVLLQVNVAGEAQKGGFAPGEAQEALRHLVALGLEVRGLMTMAPLAGDPEASRPHFRALADLRDRLAVEFPELRELSMGMTDDFAVAVEEGATILRVGRAIFRASPDEG